MDFFLCKGILCYAFYCSLPSALHTMYIVHVHECSLSEGTDELYLEERRLYFLREMHLAFTFKLQRAPHPVTIHSVHSYSSPSAGGQAGWMSSENGRGSARWSKPTSESKKLVRLNWGCLSRLSTRRMTSRPSPGFPMSCRNRKWSPATTVRERPLLVGGKS